MFARAARFVSVSAVLPAFLWFTPAHAEAARPTPAQALQLTPIQANVDYDTPTAEETDKCTVEPVKEGDVVGWALLDPTGRTLRRFLDTNGDNKVDLWCSTAGSGWAERGGASIATKTAPSTSGG
jgi:hypothetical protein